MHDVLGLLQPHVPNDNALMQRGFGVWSMSRAVARELAVPDVRLREAGIRE